MRFRGKSNGVIVLLCSVLVLIIGFLIVKSYGTNLLTPPTSSEKKNYEGFWANMVNMDAVDQMNDLGGIKDVQSSYNQIYQDLNSKESSKVESAMMQGYGIPLASNPILVAQAKVTPPPKDSVNAAKKDAEDAKKKAEAAKDALALSGKDGSPGSCGNKALEGKSQDAEAIAAAAAAEEKQKTLGYNIQTAVSQICKTGSNSSSQVAGAAGAAGTAGVAGSLGLGGSLGGTSGSAGSAGIGGTRGSVIGGSAGSSSSTGGRDGSSSSSETKSVVPAQLQMQIDLQTDIDGSKKRVGAIKAPPKPPKLPPKPPPPPPGPPPPPPQKCNPPMGNPPPTVSGWKYMGCFKDCSAGRGLPDRLGDVSSIEQCIALAKAKGYNTAGNQYFRECWAGNNTDWNRMGDAGCCEPMGGGCTQQIYTSGLAPKPPAPPPPPPAPPKSSGINIIEASYGINCNPALKGNRTDLFKGLANGKLSLDNYEYNYTTTGGDPAGGCGKTLEVSYNCSGGETKKFTAPAEAGFNAKVNLSCPNTAGPPTGLGGTRSGSGINIIEATYGINCNPGLKGNRTELFKGLANGKPSLTNYQYNFQTTGGDPAGGCGKTLEVNYNCDGGPVQKFVAPAEAGFNANVNIDCAKPTAAASSSIMDIKKIPGLQIWLDGKDPLNNGKAPADGTPIPAWMDKSGNQNDMKAQKPANYAASSSSLNFNRSLYNSKNVSVYPIDVFVIVKLQDTSGPYDICGLAQNGPDNFNSLTFGEFKRGFWHNGSSHFRRTPEASATTNETSTNFLLMQWSLANNNFYINRNGVQIMTSKSYTWDKGSPYFQLGSRLYTDAGHNLVGNIAEVLVFNAQLAGTQKQQVEGYLAWKWGLQASLPGGHPFKDAAPK